LGTPLHPEYGKRRSCNTAWKRREDSDYAAAFKPNSQFVLFSLRVRELRELTREIRSHDCISILDHKLSDIGFSNDAAIQNIRASGFDAFTASPYPGNIKETSDLAHREKTGVIFSV